MQKKSRSQRVTISSYTTHHLKTGASGICFPGDQSLSVYYCCDRCWWWHKTSTDNLVDCYPGSGIHQNLGRGMWDFFYLSVGDGKSWRLNTRSPRQMRFNKASVQLCLLSTEQNIYSDLVNDCLTEIFRKWTDELSGQKNHYFNQMPRKGAWRNSSLVNEVFLLF